MVSPANNIEPDSEKSYLLQTLAAFYSALLVISVGIAGRTVKVPRAVCFVGAGVVFPHAVIGFLAARRR